MERRVRGDGEPVSPAPGPRSAGLETPARELNPRKRPLAGSETRPGSSKRVKVEEKGRPEISVPSFKETKIKVEVNEFPRFDDLTDEIFEESDDRFRLGEDLKSRVEEQDPGRAAGGGGEERRGVEDPRASKNTRAPADSEPNTPDFSKMEISKMRKNKRKSVSISLSGNFEPLLTPYHYYIGCRNDIINKDDKLNEVAALQRGVEVGRGSIKVGQGSVEVAAL